MRDWILKRNTSIFSRKEVPEWGKAQHLCQNIEFTKNILYERISHASDRDIKINSVNDNMHLIPFSIIVDKSKNIHNNQIDKM